MNLFITIIFIGAAWWLIPSGFIGAGWSEFTGQCVAALITLITLAWYVVDGITSAIRFRNLPDEPVKPKKPTWWDKLKA